MGCMLRSDPMSICDIYIQPEIAFEVFSEFGELGCVQFQDMTPELSAFQRHYISEFCRCTEMERKLRYMENEMKKDEIHIPEIKVEPNPIHPNEMSTYETMFDKFEEDIQNMSAYQSKLIRNHEKLSEMSYVLKHVGPLLGDEGLKRDSLLVSKTIGDTFGARLYFISGVVERSRFLAFHTMLWRVSRGNIHFKASSVDKLFEDAKTGLYVRKVGFLAVCQGEQLSVRVNKICAGFRAKIYECPMNYDKRMDMLDQVETRMYDLAHVLKKSKYYRCKALINIAKMFNTWMLQVRKAKAIYHAMNLFNLDITTKCLIGQGWIPDDDIETVQDVLEKTLEDTGTNVPSFISITDTLETPPTYHRTNKFTRGFQALISAYGDSVYRELNPGLYTLITFPFLFAVMFGDVCHGSIILLFAAWMVKNEKAIIAERSTNEIWNILFGGRYVILMMGIFSTYTGFVYNDYFSNSVVLKLPYWKNHFDAATLQQHSQLSLDPSLKTNAVYFFGVDPTWALSKNKIMFENSLKMKMSIIIGVIHMMFGLWMSFFNHLHFKNKFAVFLEFIPEALFLCCLFVWLVFLIFYKWIVYGPKEDDIKLQPGCAPLILILFIDMTLMRTTVTLNDDCDAYMFANQQVIQRVLLFIGLLCVPVLLFGSPLYILKMNKKKKLEAQEKLDNFRDSRIIIEGRSRKEELLIEAVHNCNHTFGELMIHQGVHTIEFVLSTISHTASYLRLWALSLAHAELSEMLWGMVLSKLALRDYTLMGSVKLFFVFAIWASFTLAILVVMEGLSAFLHTLRLHWVEFMSKFYKGGGIIFRPFSFKEILYGEAGEDRSDEGACKKKRI